MTLIEKDKQFIWHPFTHQKNMPDPIAIVSGKGSLLFDEKGDAYIDAISSWWVNIHGHAHPYIAEKIYEQALKLEQVIFAGFTHEPAVLLAERLITLLPSFHKVFYSDNGSTSTEVALKMAIQYWWNLGNRKKKKILAFYDSYHGDTFGAMSVSDRSLFTLAYHDLLIEVIFIETPNAENIDRMIQVIESSKNEIAAFIFEPLVQGAGGMKMYEATYLNKLVDYCKQHDILCIADEVMTGFGRTGKMFAIQHLTTMPDIICLSKGLTGGTMALGVTACNEKVYSAFVEDDKTKTFFHGHSFTANPLACTSALASLDLFDQNNSLEKIQWLSQKNNSYCKQLQHFSNIKNCRIIGTILAFEIEQEKSEYLNEVSQTITKLCMQQGVYLRPLGNTVYWMPPYCITEQELQKVYDSLGNILVH